MTGTIPMFTRPPVFLQTGFRTSSTWLWSRFRSHPSVMAFCEPLNEALATLSGDLIERLRPQDAGLHHPDLEQPYFAEFRPLLQGNRPGVRLFDEAFGLQGYFEPPNVENERLQRYLQSLLDLADSQQRQPVLKFTRALGRAAWLRAHFPGARQIMLRRCPLEQFRSGWCLMRETGNLTFPMIPLYVLSRAESGPMRDLCGVLGIPHISGDAGLAVCVGHYNELARTLPMQTLLAAFLAMQMMAESACEPHVDLVIETSSLASAPMRQGVEAAILGLTGVPVSLSSFSQAQTHAPARLPAAAAELCQQACAILGADHPAAAHRLQELIGDAEQPLRSPLVAGLV